MGSVLKQHERNQTTRMTEGFVAWTLSQKSLSTAVETGNKT
jgi:hypothetical protein